jgi:hypothetical protein
LRLLVEVEDAHDDIAFGEGFVAERRLAGRGVKLPIHSFFVPVA